MAAVALAVVALSGVALTWRYRPDGAGPSNDLPPEAQWSRRLVRWHEISMLVSIPALIVWSALTLRDRPRRPLRTGFVVASTVISISLVGLTSLAWHRVRWNGLGLWAVSVGTNVTGLWYAAFSDDVRFALVGIDEVPPAQLQRWVLVHLGAPVLALVALAVGWVASQPAGTARAAQVHPRADR